MEALASSVVSKHSMPVCIQQSGRLWVSGWNEACSEWCVIKNRLSRSDHSPSMPVINRHWLNFNCTLGDCWRFVAQNAGGMCNAGNVLSGVTATRFLDNMPVEQEYFYQKRVLLFIKYFWLFEKSLKPMLHAVKSTQKKKKMLTICGPRLISEYPACEEWFEYNRFELRR